MGRSWPGEQELEHVTLMDVGEEIVWVRGDEARKIIPLTVLVSMVGKASAYQRINGRGAYFHHGATSYVMNWTVAEWVHDAIVSGFAHH